MKKTKAKTKKNLIIFIILFFIMSISVGLYAASTIITNPTELQFEDKNLYDAIKDNIAAKKIKYNENDVTMTIEVSQDDVNNIEELNLQGADGAKIVNINGLQRFINLKKINLTNNNITDISAISELAYLTSIDLSNNLGVTICDTTKCYLPNQSNLQELNIANTSNNDISFVSRLKNLKDLNISNNGINVLTSLRTLENLEKLDVSNNDIGKINDILYLSTLKDLNISNTKMTILAASYNSEDLGISSLENLECLNVSGNNLTTLEHVYKLYYNEGKEEYEAHLKNLKELNIDSTGQSYVDWWSLAYLSNLTHLYMKDNEIYDISSEITKLRKLEYINLSYNNIEDISGFISYDSEYNIEATLAATKIELAHNKIQDIKPIGKINHDITYLDLSENAVFYIDAIDNGKFSFKEGLNLRRQGLGYDEFIYIMYVTDKVAELDQYIILPTLFQNSKRNGSIVYADDINFTTQNAELNGESKYNEPGYYNIIINHETSEETDISIVLNGGCADESTLHFKITTSDDSVDSLIFPDVNLAEAVYNEINKKILEMGEENLYVKRAIDILNITNLVIDSIDTLELAQKGIQDLTGLSNFENLSKLNLADNNISSIEELRFSTKMTDLNISNNINIGNNNKSIQQMTELEELNISNIGITNIDSLRILINKWTENDYFPLKYLNISNNQLEDIEDIEKITSLEELNISNIGITDISKIEALNNLITFNASMNKIKDIEVLKTLTKLKYLILNNNQIENVVPICRIALNQLDLSSNKIKDITSLTRNYSELDLSYNQISDINNLGASIPKFSAKGQKILNVLDEDMTGDILVNLPEIFKTSKIKGSKVYTETDFICVNCDLSNDGKVVVINKENLGNKFATVKISGGNAHGTTFVIAQPVKGTITYTPSNETLTNQDVIAKIEFNRSNVAIKNNEGKDTYTFTQNGEFTFEYVDEYGFEGTTTATVNNIDKIVPQSTEVSKQIINKSIRVTIKVSEPVLQPEGWILAENKLSLSKTFTEDSNETVNLVDEAGNIGLVNVQVKIDKTAPIITGVENNQKYKKSVTPVVQDENLDTVTLTKDGNVVTSYKLGNIIKESGQYVLTATDKFENTTTVSFEIEEILDIITSEKVTVIEEQQIIKDLKPETTVAEMKNIIQSDAEYEIIDKNGNTISETSKIGTGYKVKMETGKTYTIIVRGDSNGDGNADLRDILVINKHRLKKASLTGEYLQAGDVNEDGKSDLRDILQINKYRLGKINEL